MSESAGPRNRRGGFDRASGFLISVKDVAVPAFRYPRRLDGAPSKKKRGRFAKGIRSGKRLSGKVVVFVVVP